MLPVLGKWLIVVGLMLMIAGAVLWGLGAIGGVGRLPGDIMIRRGNFTFYFPLGSCILLSIILSLLVMLLRR